MPKPIMGPNKRHRNVLRDKIEGVNNNSNHVENTACKLQEELY